MLTLHEPLSDNYVDYSLVTAGRTEEDAHLNAKLSISIARKMGATIWFVVLYWPRERWKANTEQARPRGYLCREK